MCRAFLFGLGALLLPVVSALGDSPGRSSVSSPKPPPPRELKALSTGPVHEAFLSTRGDREPLTLPQSPPPPVIERPSFEPTDHRAVWIGGYWDWERSRDDFVWVTGTWRVPPPGQLWVNTYWKRDENGWRRIPGFWSDRRTSRLEYRAEGPPANRPDEDPGRPPKPNCFYIPGEYVPDGDQIVWKKGYWADAQPGWSWVPARWIRQSEGWVFQNGFWDRPLEERGVLFAPAALADNADEVGQLYYSPYTIISPEIYGQLYGAIGRAGVDYDGYAGASYDDDGRYYYYANYGMLSNYYGYLDYPNLGAFGYPYYVEPLIYQSYGYSYPPGMISGLNYGGLGYGIGGLGLGIVNPGWGYPIWSGGWGRPSWTGWGWSGPSWGSWPGWSWGFPGWGWNWYWPTWAGNGWSGPSWGSIGGWPLAMTDWGWGGFGFGGIGNLFGFGGLAANSAVFGAPFALTPTNLPRSTSAIPFQNTGRGHLVDAARVSRPGLATGPGTSNFVNRGTMRQAPLGAGGAGSLANSAVKPPPSSRPFASLSPRGNLAGLGRMRTQGLQANRTTPATGPIARQATLASGAGSWSSSFNGAMRGPSAASRIRSDAFLGRTPNPNGGFVGRMRTGPEVGSQALGAPPNLSRGFNPAMRSVQTPRQFGAVDPSGALRGMRSSDFNPQSRGFGQSNLGATGFQGRAPGIAQPNLGAMRGGNPALVNPGAGSFGGGAMRGGGPSGFNPGFSGGAMRGGGTFGGPSGLGGSSPGFSGGSMRGGGGFGGSSPGFSGGAMRGGGGFGGGGFGGGMGSPGAVGGGMGGAGPAGGGFGGGMR